MENKKYILESFIAYCILWIPKILNFLFRISNFDILFLCAIFSVLIITDAKIKSNNVFVNFSFIIITGFFIIVMIFQLI